MVLECGSYLLSPETGEKTELLVLLPPTEELPVMIGSWILSAALQLGIRVLLKIM